MNLSLSDIRGRPIAILGGGVLGRRIACMWAAGGWNVNIRDPSAEQRIAALHYVENNINEYPKITGISKVAGTVQTYEKLEDAVKNAWTVIEAVPEKLQLKIDTFAELEGATSLDCLLCSNSSSYKSSEMLEKVKPETCKRIFNTHYMMPPQGRVVELMTDGHTNAEIFPFYVECLKEVGFLPVVARKESTGFVFNRLWAAIKRECLTILSEGVSTPEELDAVWVDMYSSGNKMGPCGMMDAVGLDTVTFIEEHYIQERGLSGVGTIDYLKREFLSKGKLGAKSGEGGLYPPGQTTKTSSEAQGDLNNLHAPTLYVLDLGINSPQDPLYSGRILVGSGAGGDLRTIVSGQSLPDGIDVSIETGRIYWTNMGIPSANDGEILSSKLDGSDIQTLIPKGSVHTPKQLILDPIGAKLYFCDREGLRIMRCNLDGSEHETLVQNGDWHDLTATQDQSKWCVGITMSQNEKKFYWTQKGISKGGIGRIFRANIDMPAGKDASTRDDIEMVLDHLPEPIDLEVDPDNDTLLWTDRGDPPFGNTLNKIALRKLQQSTSVSNQSKPEILARNLHEAIGLRLDRKNKHIYITDLGGSVYRINIDGTDKKRVYDTELALSGINLTYV